jgi:Putative bacterial sensory transduction regulator
MMKPALITLLLAFGMTSLAQAAPKKAPEKISEKSGSKAKVAAKTKEKPKPKTDKPGQIAKPAQKEQNTEALKPATAKADKTYPEGGVTAQEVIGDLKSLGHTAKLAKDSAGDPLIEATFAAGDKNISYKLFFFGCKKGRCSSLQYFVALDGTAVKAGKWNEENRFARAYMSGKQVHLEYDVDLESGATSKAVKNSAERWKATMVTAVSFLN